MKIPFLLAVLLLSAACSPPPHVDISPSPSPVRSAAAGCWRLESSPGLLGRLLETTVVRLDTATYPDGRMRMLRIPDADGVRDMNHWGTTDGGERLVLSFSNGFGGVVVQATVDGDRLRGRARTWADTLVWVRRGRVRGVRVPCPAQPAAG
jgi:hypothetical protein